MYVEYGKEKTLRKTQKAEEEKDPMQDFGGSSYTKLYKQLGPHSNNNKDIRRQLQEEVDLYTDN